MSILKASMDGRVTRGATYWSAGDVLVSGGARLLEIEGDHACHIQSIDDFLAASSWH